MQRQQALQDREQSTEDYVVRSGDNLSTIAQSNNMALSKIMRLNGLGYHSIIHPGDVLKLSERSSSVARSTATQANSTQEYVVEIGDSLWRIAEKNNVSVQSIMELNGLGMNTIIHPNQRLKLPSRARPASRNQESAVAQEKPKKSEDPVVEKEKKSTNSNGYNAALGKALAAASMRETGGRRRSQKDCYKYVANAVDRVIGRFLYGMHAYMAASQLASRKDLFVEISAGNLTSLPAGAIVVWGKGNTRSGHISIAQGNGMETSDFLGPQMTSHYGGAPARVFLPKARM